MRILIRLLEAVPIILVAVLGFLFLDKKLLLGLCTDYHYAVVSFIDAEIGAIRIVAVTRIALVTKNLFAKVSMFTYKKTL